LGGGIETIDTGALHVRKRAGTGVLMNWMPFTIGSTNEMVA
jgi:hypothetical protein